MKSLLPILLFPLVASATTVEFVGVPHSTVYANHYDGAAPAVYDAVDLRGTVDFETGIFDILGTYEDEFVVHLFSDYDVESFEDRRLVPFRFEVSAAGAPLLSGLRDCYFLDADLESLFLSAILVGDVDGRVLEVGSDWRLSAVPEPDTFLLVGAVMIFFGLGRFDFKNKRSNVLSPVGRHDAVRD